MSVGCHTPARPQVVLDGSRGRDINERNYNVRFYGNPGECVSVLLWLTWLTVVAA